MGAEYSRNDNGVVKDTMAQISEYFDSTKEDKV